MGGGENPTYSLIFSKMFLFLFHIGLELCVKFLAFHDEFVETIQCTI